MPGYGCCPFWGGAMANDQMPSPADPMLAILKHRIETMHEDFTEMRTVLKELSAAITRLALIEERQGQSNEAQERAFKVLAALEQRVSALEKRVPENNRTTLWLDRAALSAVAAVFVYIAKQVGLL